MGTLHYVFKGGMEFDHVVNPPRTMHHIRVTQLRGKAVSMKSPVQPTSLPITYDVDDRGWVFQVFCENLPEAFEIIVAENQIGVTISPVAAS